MVELKKLIIYILIPGREDEQLQQSIGQIPFRLNIFDHGHWI